MIQFIKRKIALYKANKITKRVEPGLKILVKCVEPLFKIPGKLNFGYDDNQAVLDRWNRLKHSVPIDTEQLATLSKRVTTWKAQLNGCDVVEFSTTYKDDENLISAASRAMYEISNCLHGPVIKAVINPNTLIINLVTTQLREINKCQTS